MARTRLTIAWVLPFVVLVMIGVARTCQATDKEIPYLAERVTDNAGIIPADVRQRIEGKLAIFEKQTGAQLAVLTIDSLDGEVLEDYSMRVAQTWKLGRQGVDNGVLFLIAKNDRKMRLEVGYGLESKLPDVICGRILDNGVRPRFRQGDFGGGVEAGVDSVIGVVAGTAEAPVEASSSAVSITDAPWPARLAMGFIFFIVVGVFSVIAVFLKGCSGWGLWAFLLPFYLTFPLVILGPIFGPALFILWLIGGPILRILFGHTAFGQTWISSHPGLKSFATNISSSSGGSGSSGGGWSSGSSGGFSGGGGSFGGGGSSSSW